MELKKKNNNNNPFSIIADILALFVLDLATILEHISSHLNNILLTFLQLIIITEDDTKSATDEKFDRLSQWRSQELGSGVARVISSYASCYPSAVCSSATGLSRGEVQMVMERLGILHKGGDDELDELFRGVGPDEIADVFVEQEPSLDEVKEAFEVFDGNGDGVIDAGELCKLLGAVGFGEVGESDCERLMVAFDENGDGVIDLIEFTKLVEKSLS